MPGWMLFGTYLCTFSLFNCSSLSVFFSSIDFVMRNTVPKTIQPTDGTYWVCLSLYCEAELDMFWYPFFIFYFLFFFFNFFSKFSLHYTYTLSYKYNYVKLQFKVTSFSMLSKSKIRGRTCRKLFGFIIKPLIVTTILIRTRSERSFT